MAEFNLSNTADSSKVFLVNQSNLEGRIDSYFYKKDFQLMIESLNNSKFETLPLKKIIKSINNGFDFRDYKDFGIPYIKVANVKQGEFDFNKIQYIDFSSDEITKNIQLKKGNILLTRKGTYGNALSLDKDYDYVISSEVFYIELKTELIDSKYLEIFFNSNIGQKQFNRVSIGAIMGSLSQEALKTLKIPVPPKAIQQQIIDLYQTAYTQKQQKEAQATALLASIDTYLLNELGITLPEKDTSLQSRIFTTMFSEVSGGRFDVFYNDIFYLEIDKKISNCNFPFKRLKKLCYSVSGVVYSGNDERIEGIPILRGNNISLESNELNFDSIRYIRNDIELSDDLKLKREDIFMSSASGSKEHVGKVAYIEEDLDYYFGGFMMVLRKRNNDYNQKYFFEFLQSNLFRMYLYKNLGGTNINNLNYKMIANLKVPFPPPEKQTEIANHIQGIRAQAKQLKEDAKAVLEGAKQEVEKMILG